MKTFPHWSVNNSADAEESEAATPSSHTKVMQCTTRARLGCECGEASVGTRADGALRLLQVGGGALLAVSGLEILQGKLRVREALGVDEKGA